MRAENGALVDRCGGHAPGARALGARPRAAAGAGGDGALGGEHPRARGGHARRQPLLLRSALRPGDVPARAGRRGRVPARRRAARRLPIADFVVGPYQTALAQGELLTAVRIPVLPKARALRTRSSPSTSGRRRPSPAWRGLRTASWPRRASRSDRWARGRSGRAAAEDAAHRCARGRARRRRARRRQVSVQPRMRRPWTTPPAPPSTRRSSCKVLVERTFREALA